MRFRTGLPLPFFIPFSYSSARQHAPNDQAYSFLRPIKARFAEGAACAIISLVKQKQARNSGPAPTPQACVRCLLPFPASQPRRSLSVARRGFSPHPQTRRQIPPGCEPSSSQRSLSRSSSQQSNPDLGMNPRLVHIEPVPARLPCLLPSRFSQDLGHARGRIGNITAFTGTVQVSLIFSFNSVDDSLVVHSAGPNPRV